MRDPFVYVSRGILIALLSLSFVQYLPGAGYRNQAQRQVIKLAEVPKELPLVDFIAGPPAIDGILDPALQKLPRRAFSQVEPYDTAEKPVEAEYRLAYGTDFLYVYVESKGDKLTYNDRAYQNGDGFHMVISKVLPGNAPTDEFYVAACSAVNRPNLEYSRRIFWYYNVDKIFVAMNRQAKLEAAAHDGVISFELLLPWADLHPYHPWLSEGIGFNLGFVKASGKGGFYYRVLPEDLGQENEPRRYIPLRFAKPVLEQGMQTFVQLDRNHVRRGETLKARAVTVSAGPGKESLTVSLKGGEGSEAGTTSAAYACLSGLSRHAFEIKLGNLPTGGYRLDWRSNLGLSKGDETFRAAALTILPEADAAALGKRLQSVKSRLSPGSFTTLQFIRDEIFQSLRLKKSYENAAAQYTALNRLETDLAEAEAGLDTYAERTGIVRRAYLSKVDDTLQPYVVRIPADFDPKAGKKYPLLVFLHGSASDETNLAGMNFLSQGDFIEAGPRGRGPSNAFTRDHAQEDIEDVIKDVIGNYSIDDKRIVLTGFSMGGYGVLRTFFEHPERYKALAIFSGSPDVAARYFPGENHPDFLRERNLRKFAGMPVFIFHGRADRNCPFPVMEELVRMLKNAGAKVQFVVEEGAGHQRPNPESLKLYYDWLKKFAGK